MNRGKYTKLVAIIIITNIVVYLEGEGEGLGLCGPRFYDCLLTMQHVSILYSKKNGDADILLSKNQIKAVCRMVFNVVKRTIELHDTPNL